MYININFKDQSYTITPKPELKSDMTFEVINSNDLNFKSFIQDIFSINTPAVTSNRKLYNQVLKKHPAVKRFHDSIGSLQLVKESLHDAPIEVKEAFNTVVGYFDNEKYCVIMTGGSLGDQNSKHFRYGGKLCSIVESNLSNEEAKETAKRYRKLLSPGEKSYYGISYLAVPCSKIKELNNWNP